MARTFALQILQKAGKKAPTAAAAAVCLTVIFQKVAKETVLQEYQVGGHNTPSVRTTRYTPRMRIKNKS